MPSKAESRAMDLAFWRRVGASVKLAANRAIADEAEIHAPDFKDRLSFFATHKVDYLVVGGNAVGFHA